LEQKKTRPPEDPLRRDWIQVDGLGGGAKTVGNTCHAASIFPTTKYIDLLVVFPSGRPIITSIIHIHAIAQPYHQRLARALRRGERFGPLLQEQTQESGSH
jgi:hypothetical protein